MDGDRRTEESTERRELIWLTLADLCALVLGYALGAFPAADALPHRSRRRRRLSDAQLGRLALRDRGVRDESGLGVDSRYRGSTRDMVACRGPPIGWLSASG